MQEERNPSESYSLDIPTCKQMKATGSLSFRVTRSRLFSDKGIRSDIMPASLLSQALEAVLED